MVQARTHAVGNALGISPGDPFPSKLRQGLLRRQRRVVTLLRILVGELIEREAAAIRDLERAGRLNVLAELDQQI